MKPLKKKLCISVCLDKLFEVVDDDDAKSEKRETTSLVRSRAPVPQEEFLLRRPNRWRMYRSEWLKYRKESYYYRSALHKVESYEGWPIRETIRRRMKTPSKDVQHRKDSSGDTYSLTCLKQDQEKGSRENNTEKLKVDVALSTSFLASSAMVVRKQFRPVSRIERGTSTREHVDVSTQTDGEDHAAVGDTGNNKFHKGGITVYSYTTEYSMRNRIISNVLANKKSFLATKSTKKTNLSLRNHKSTQLDFGDRLNLDAFSGDRGKYPKGKGTKLAEVSDQDKKLEELFHYKNSRKFSFNALRRGMQVKKNQPVGKGSSRGSRLIHPRVSSEPKITQHRMDAMVRKRSRGTCSSGHASEDCLRTYTKKSLGSVTLKSDIKSNVECFLCYTMSVPWEMTLNQISNRMIPFEVESSLPDETPIDESLNLFRVNCWRDSDANTFRMETECEIAPTRVQSVIDTVAKTEPEPYTDAKPDGDNDPFKDTAPLQDGGPANESKESDGEVNKEEIRMEVVEKTLENELSKVKTNSEDSLYLRHMILQALGPQIMEEVKQLSMKQEISQDVLDPTSDNPTNAEAAHRDLMVQWELEIEIQSHDTGNVTAWKQLVNESSSRGALKAVEESKTDVVLLCPSKGHDHATTDSSSQHSCGSEVEECYLKDEKMRKIYRANVPRHLLLATEQRLKEIGRG